MPARFEAFRQDLVLAVANGSCIGEDPLAVLAKLPARDLERCCVQWNGDRSAVLRLIRTDPGVT